MKDRTLTKLYNARPAWLAACHAKLDTAVAAAYGWPANLSEEAIVEKLLELKLGALLTVQAEADELRLLINGMAVIELFDKPIHF